MPFGEILLKMAAQQALSDDEEATLRLVGNQIELNSTVVDGWASTGGTVAPTFNYATLSYPKFITDILVFLGSTVTTRIDADGDIFFGSDVGSPGTTSFVVFSNAQTYNGESVGAGDLLIGDNSSGKANIFWDQSAGALYFRLGTVITNLMSSTAIAAVGAKIYRDTSQTIGDNSLTNITFEYEAFDDAAFVDLVAQPTRITIPSGYGARYEIHSTITWAANTTGLRSLQLWRNNTTLIANSRFDGSATTGSFTQMCGTDIELDAADYLQVKVVQTSGGSLDISATGGIEEQPNFYIRRVR